MQFYRFSILSRAFLWAVLLLEFLALSARAGETSYVVQRNDTLYGIAEEHGVSVAKLAERNNLTKNYHVRTGQRLFIPDDHSSAKTDSSKSTAPKTIIVKRNDTLFGLAEKHGVSVSQLAAYNGLSKNYRVRIGQRLSIPHTHSTASSAAGSLALPSAVGDAIQDAHVRQGRWKYIVIHHSGVDEGTVKGMDRYHREVRHMENGLAYHFVIGNGHGMRDGEIAVGHRWRAQLDGGHLRSLAQNKIAIGICLVGNFDKHVPSSRQMRSLKALVKALMTRCHLSTSAIKTHQQINIIGTRCPGKHFPIKSFVTGLKS